MASSRSTAAPKSSQEWHGDRFTHVKQRVQDKLDHRNVNEILDFSTTAENMARWICEQVPNAYKVSFQESEGNVAVYVKPGCENADL